MIVKGWIGIKQANDCPRGKVYVLGGGKDCCSGDHLSPPLALQRDSVAMVYLNDLTSAVWPLLCFGGVAVSPYQ